MLPRIKLSSGKRLTKGRICQYRSLRHERNRNGKTFAKIRLPVRRTTLSRSVLGFTFGNTTTKPCFQRCGLWLIQLLKCRMRTTASSGCLKGSNIEVRAFERQRSKSSVSSIALSLKKRDAPCHMHCPSQTCFAYLAGQWIDGQISDVDHIGVGFRFRTRLRRQRVQWKRRFSRTFGSTAACSS